MPKSIYFNQGAYQPEKDLLMGLSQELINIHGINIEYISNPYTNVDALYREDRLPLLGLSKTLVVLPKNALEGVDGNAMFSKFGFLNQQQFTFQVAVKEWKEIFNTHRPMEGDLFYIKTMDEYGPADFFKITFVDREDGAGWFPLGKHHVFDVTAEKWAYASEDFAHTGVAEIDTQLPDWSNDIVVNNNLQADLNKVNDVVQTTSNVVVDWTESNPFGES